MTDLKPISMLGAVAGVQVVAVAAAWVLRRRDRLLQEQLPYLVSLAVGVLLGTALLHLLPEAIGLLGNRRAVWMSVGGTMVALFGVERIFYAVTGVRAEQPDPQRMLREHEAREHGHTHGGGCSGETGGHDGRVMQPMSLVLASMLHSFVDGATISTAFAASARIGWLTAFAVALHEIPHRIGDFALFLHLGVRKGRALAYAMIEGVPAFAGLGAVLVLGTEGVRAIHWLLPISAGSFLYLAMVSLMPELQIECQMGRVVGQIGCLVGGVVIVAALAGLPGS
jgi:zinc and cadmium transporter